MKNIAVIFDNDGVLINSTRSGMIRHQFIAQQMGLPSPSFNLLRTHWGKVWENEFINTIAVDLNWPLCRVSEFLNTYRTRYLHKPYPAMPGIHELIAYLTRRQVRIAILSSREKNDLKNKLALAHIQTDKFDFIQGHDDWQYIKPDPRVFDPAINYYQTYNIPIKQIYFIGDTLIDWEATRRHSPRINFIAMVSGATTFDQFREHGVPTERILREIIHVARIIFP